MPIIQNYSELVQAFKNRLSADTSLRPEQRNQKQNDSTLMNHFYRLMSVLKKSGLHDESLNPAAFIALLESPFFAEHSNNIDLHGQDYVNKLNCLASFVPQNDLEQWLLSLYEYYLVKRPQATVQIEQLRKDNILSVTEGDEPEGFFKDIPFVYKEMIVPWININNMQSFESSSSSNSNFDDASSIDLNAFLRMFSEYYKKTINFLKHSPSSLTSTAMRFILHQGVKPFDDFMAWHKEKDWNGRYVHRAEATDQRLRAYGYILDNSETVSDHEVKKVLFSENACRVVNVLAHAGRLCELNAFLESPCTNDSIKEALSLNEQALQQDALSLLLLHPWHEWGANAKEVREHLNHSSYVGNWRNRNIKKTLTITNRLMSNVNDPAWLWQCIRKHCKQRYHYFALEAMINCRFDKQMINSLLHADDDKELSEQYALLIIGLKYGQQLSWDNLSRLLMPAARSAMRSEIKSFQACEKGKFIQLAMALDCLLKQDTIEKRQPSFYQSIEELLTKEYDFSCTEAIKPEDVSQRFLSVRDVRRYWEKHKNLPFQKDGLIDPIPLWHEKFSRFAKKNKFDVTLGEKASDTELARSWQALQFLEQCVMDKDFFTQLLSDSDDNLFWIYTFSSLYSQGFKLDAPLIFEGNEGLDSLWNNIKTHPCIPDFHRKNERYFHQLKSLKVKSEHLKAFVSLNETQQKQVFNVLDEVGQSVDAMNDYLCTPGEPEKTKSIENAKSVLKKNIMEVSIEHLSSENKGRPKQVEDQLTQKLDQAQKAFINHSDITPSLGLRDILKVLCNVVSVILLCIPFALNYALTGKIGFFSGSGAEHQLDCISANVKACL